MASTRLRELLSRGIVAAPGAYDGLSARLVEAAGFDAVYASGRIARAAGYPDIGLLSFSEVMDRVEIVDAGGRWWPMPTPASAARPTWSAPCARDGARRRGRLPHRGPVLSQALRTWTTRA